MNWEIIEVGDKTIIRGKGEGQIMKDLEGHGYTGFYNEWDGKHLENLSREGLLDMIKMT